MKQLVTPKVEFSHNRYYPSEAGFFQAKEKSKGGPSISCLINVKSKNGTGGEVHTFYIDPTTGIVTMADDSLEKFSDAYLFKEAIDALKQELDSRQEAKRQLRKKRAKVAAWIVVLGGATFGVYTGIDDWHNSDVRAARHAAEQRAAFDRQGYNLPGTVTPVSNIDVGNVDPDEFKQIPFYHKGDDLKNARRFNLTNETCKVFPVVIAPQEKIVVATSRTDDIHNQPIVAGVNTRHDLTLCSTQAYPGQYSNWTLAAQIEK